MSKKKKISWTIDYVANGMVCPCCGKKEDSLIPGTCNAHTHGMDCYNHPDFQFVLAYPLDHICYLLNEMGCRVRDGQRFKDGQVVEDLFLDCPVVLKEFEETGRKVLRIVAPDMKGHFPEDAECEELYKLQLLDTEGLSLCSKHTH